LVEEKICDGQEAGSQSRGAVDRAFAAAPKKIATCFYFCVYLSLVFFYRVFGRFVRRGVQKIRGNVSAVRSRQKKKKVPTHLALASLFF
jgi:hypothetical protein